MDEGDHIPVWIVCDTIDPETAAHKAVYADVKILVNAELEEMSEGDKIHVFRTTMSREQFEALPDL